MAGQSRGDRMWMVRAFLGRGSDGKRRYHNHMVHGTKKDAQAYLNAALRERDLGTFVEPSKETVGAFLDRWSKTVLRQRVKASSFAKYQNYVRLYLLPDLEKIKLRDLTAVDLQALYARLLDRGLAPLTVRNAHAIMSSALKQAVRWGSLAQNVASLVDLPRSSRREMRALTAEEARSLLAAADGDDLLPLWTLALDTGARPEEYLVLRWDDFDPEAPTITIQRALIRRAKGGGWYLEDTKTTGSRRVVTLAASTVRALQGHRSRQAKTLLAAGEGRGHAFIFTARNGEPLHTARVRRAFKDLLAKAKLPPEVRLYDLRHTCATLLLAAGVNPKVVAERLGHASITALLRTYAHVLPGMQTVAAAQMEALLHPGAAAAQKAGTL